MSNSSNGSSVLPSRLHRANRLVVFVDIRLVVDILTALPAPNRRVEFLDGFYDLCISHLEDDAGGEVVKLMGDSVLAVFDEDKVADALTALGKLREAFPLFVRTFGVPPSVKADLRGCAHFGDVVLGEFSRKGIRDCLGTVVSQAISMSSPNIAISEQVYRKLPSGDRGPRRERSAEVSYVLG